MPWLDEVMDEVHRDIFQKNPNISQHAEDRALQSSWDSERQHSYAQRPAPASGLILIHHPAGKPTIQPAPERLV
jgi:hypothetical protein